MKNKYPANILLICALLLGLGTSIVNLPIAFADEASTSGYGAKEPDQNKTAAQLTSNCCGVEKSQNGPLSSLTKPKDANSRASTVLGIDPNADKTKETPGTH